MLISKKGQLTAKAFNEGYIQVKVGRAKDGSIHQTEMFIQSGSYNIRTLVWDEELQIFKSESWVTASVLKDATKEFNSRPGSFPSDGVKISFVEEPNEAVEAPAVEAPAVEAPAVEAPAVEAPAVEAPAVVEKTPEFVEGPWELNAETSSKPRKRPATKASPDLEIAILKERLDSLEKWELLSRVRKLESYTESATGGILSLRLRMDKVEEFIGSL